MVVSPEPGTYISFSLDVKDTFSLHNCDLDEATAERLKEISSRKYVGYCEGVRWSILVISTILINFVSKYNEIPFPQKKYHQIRIRLLHHGLMTPIPKQNIEADMCVPVYPETSHPLSRPTFVTNKTLPWTGCYHSTCADVALRLPTMQIDYRNAYVASSRQRGIIDYYSREDCDRRDGEIDPYDTETVSSLVSAEVDSDMDDTKEQHDVGDECGDDDSSDAMSCSSWASSKYAARIDPRSLVAKYSDRDEATKDIEVSQDYNFTPVVKYTPDLSGIEVLYDAWKLLCDMAEVER